MTNEYIQKLIQQKENLQDSLECEYNLQSHSKRHILFELAWEYGHSGGEQEVRTYYGELIELLTRDVE